MDPHSRRNATPLTLQDTIFRESGQFSFHAAVKVLEAMRHWSTPPGESGNIFEESLIISSNPSFSMRPTDIESIQYAKTPLDLPRMEINFFGIETRQGPLPDPYIAHLLERIEHGDIAFHRFLSIFNHRLASILHRIRKKYWIGISTNKPEITLLGKTVNSFVGLNNTHLSNRLAIPERSLLYFAGLFWQKPRAVIGLKKLIQHFFKHPFRIEQLIGQWHFVEEEQQTMIGEKTGRFKKLGQDAILGQKFWNQETFFRVIIGPLSLKEFINFLKPGICYRQILDLIKFYVGADQAFQLNLILRKGEMPKIKLGRGAALSWTSWLTQKTNTEKDTQVVIDSNPRFTPVYVK